jgi:hypothetical protein
VVSWSPARTSPSLLSLLGRGVVTIGRRLSTAPARAVLTAAAAVARVLWRFSLQAGGYSLLTLAAWTWSPIAGYATAGLSLLMLEWAVKR